MSVLVGANVTETWTSTTLLTDGDGHALGNRLSKAGKEYVFVQANGAITGDGYVVSIDEAYQAVMVDTDTAATVTEGDSIGVAETAFADNDYGWVQIYGAAGVRTAASSAANTRLGPTATAGQVDDAGTTAGTSKFIEGMVLHTATGGAAAVNTTGFLTYPRMRVVGDVA